ncbi:hypothetical protein [Paenibacillus sp. 1P03SA]|uniref:hypothetical protein n=1 Tax=Paenibacillus sp. 1P03SA TaxID=3132294 RepID=UPI0039A2E2C6
MAKYLSFTFVIIVSLLLLYFYPMLNSYEQMDQISYNVTYKATTNFVDSVRTKGYITPTMYNDFQKELGKTDNLFDVQLEHDQKKYTPVYADPADPNTFKGEYGVHYEGFFNEQILGKLFPDNNLPLNDPSRRYLLRVGDTFSVTVKNKNMTKATLVRDFLNNGNTSDPTRIYVPYGGMVLNEDY